MNILFIENVRVVVSVNIIVRVDSRLVVFGNITLSIKAEIHNVRIVSAEDTDSNIKKFINRIFGFIITNVFINSVDIMKKKGGRYNLNLGRAAAIERVRIIFSIL